MTRSSPDVSNSRNWTDTTSMTGSSSSRKRLELVVVPKKQNVRPMPSFSSMSKLSQDWSRLRTNVKTVGEQEHNEGSVRGVGVEGVDISADTCNTCDKERKRNDRATLETLPVQRAGVVIVCLRV